METPPHTWSRLKRRHRRSRQIGNTSTYVEQTAAATAGKDEFRKHLHIRGADRIKHVVPLQSLETPPHTWSRLAVLCLRPRFDRKHLHIRGADRYALGGTAAQLETPPHTWSRPCCVVVTRFVFGNTSTYVEQTRSLDFRCAFQWKHLHIRGADKAAVCSFRTEIETPPHTWSRRSQRIPGKACRRNTSTYVEQTETNIEKSTGFSETPPHTWSRLDVRIERGFFRQKHLHIRGADNNDEFCHDVCSETPPHTWSRLL